MVRVITDSTSSLPVSMREDLGVETLSLYVNRNGVEHLESEMDLDDFYADIYEMVDDIPTSSQPSAASMRQAFERAACEGEDVLGVFLSSKMSGSFEGAVRAAKEVSARYPAFSFAIIDSLTNCLEMGWSVVAGAEAARAGASLAECTERAKAALHAARFIFAPESLRFLEKGGRIGRATALIGNMINISPILTVKDGVASTYAKVRTQKKAMTKMVEVFKEDVRACGLRHVAVHYIGSKELAVEWAREIIEPLVGERVLVVPASPVIGVHVGPAVGLAYECQRALPGKFTGAGPEVVG